jgi:hypothetical protein
MAAHALSDRPDENVAHPLAATFYTVSLFHCLAASLSEQGEGLGIAWGEDGIREALADAGFGPARRHALDGDPFNVYYLAGKD